MVVVLALIVENDGHCSFQSQGSSGRPTRAGGRSCRRWRLPVMVIIALRWTVIVDAAAALPTRYRFSVLFQMVLFVTAYSAERKNRHWMPQPLLE